MNSKVNVEKLIKDIKNYTSIETKEDFNKYLTFFLDIKYNDLRKNLYNEIMVIECLSNLAEAKHLILKNLFSEYISNSIVEANDLNSDNESYAAKLKVDELQKLANIFKSHDGIDYKDFISQVEPRLSILEASLLFHKPELNKDELEDIRSAIINALGKKYTEISSKDEFQSKFFNHPLINCLNAYADINFINNQIQDDVFQFGHYENLIKTLIKLNTKEINEEYQGFITFLIKEDLTNGFSKILKNKNYKPKYLYDLLKKITEGLELDDSDIKELIVEIKDNHTKNLRLDSNQELIQNKSSKHSLNDFGFYFNIKNKEIFFHGHETIGTGVNQNNQQANTALIQRNFNQDTLGLTILGNNITRDESHKCWINSEGFKGLLKITQIEEIALTGLQFDAQNFKVISLNKDKDIEVLKNGDFLNSNNYIVKSDIQRSKNLINMSIGKNDLELIFEKKNVYLNIFKNNIDFFQQVLKTTSTNNQAQYQLISQPFLDFIKAVRKIEKNKEISIFTNDDIGTLKKILEPIANSTFNVSVSSMVDDVLEILTLAPYKNYSNNYTELVELCKTDVVKSLNTLVKKESQYDNTNVNNIMKVIKDSNSELVDVLKSMDKYPVGENTSKKMKTMLIKSFKQKIVSSAPSYNSNKAERIIEDIDTACFFIGQQYEINCNLSDYKITNKDCEKSYRLSVRKMISELLMEKNPYFKNDAIAILKSFCYLANLTGAKIICSGIELEKRIKNNI